MNNTNPRAPTIRSSESTLIQQPDPRPQPQLRNATDLPDQDQLVLQNTGAAALELPRSWLDKARFFKAALIIGGLLVVLLLAVETIGLVSTLLGYHWLLATVLIGLLVAFIGLLTLGVWREYRQLRQLRTLGKLQSEGEVWLNSDGYGGADDYIRTIKSHYAARTELQSALATFDRFQDAQQTDSEQVQRLIQDLGQPLDQQAQQVIARHVRQLSVITALNPLALVDSLLVFWLSVRMIRGIAQVYGHRPGLVASWQLLRQVLILVTATGATDLVADASSDMLGAGLVGMVSAKLSQGIVTGLLVARVGLYTIKLCRPLPLVQEQTQLWTGLKKEVFNIFGKQS